MRQLTFAIYRVKVLKLTFPLPAVAPIATAAVIATGDGADEAGPHTALRPRLTPVYENAANEELV